MIAYHRGLGLLILAATTTSCATHAPRSDHYDGTRFFNDEPGHTLSDTIKWLWEMETVPWPVWIQDAKQPVPPPRVRPGRLRVTYINHATLLIQLDGLNILTDPIWSFRAGPTSWIGVKRVRAPGLRLEDLPLINLVLISHDHYDHLDLPSLEKIAQRDQPTVLVGLGVKELLVDRGIKKVVALDWWQRHRCRDQLEVVFVPAWHGSGRLPLRADRTLWGGFVIDSPHGQVYFAGDTALGSFVSDIQRRFSRIRLAILPLGSYEKRWFMKSQHMNPDDAVRTHQLLGAAQSVGMHFATFAEHPEQAIDAHELDLARALRAHHVPAERFWILHFGEGRDVNPLEPIIHQ